MKKILLNTVLATSFLFNQNLVYSKQLSNLEKSMNQFNAKVFVEGEKVSDSVLQLVTEIRENKITMEELTNYVKKTSTASDFEKFQSQLSSISEDVKGLDQLSSQDLSFLLKNTLNNSQKTGAHFLSCQTGLAAGGATVLVSIILAIRAISNSKINVNEVYAELTDKNTELIDRSGPAISELNDFVEELEANDALTPETLSQLEALESEQVDLFIEEYQSNIAWKDKKLKRKNNAKGLAIASAVVGALGIGTGVIGFTNCDMTDKVEDSEE
jgi:hypothetical protein